MGNINKKVLIIELRKKGYSINKIVSELKCAKSTVSYHINREGLGGIRDNFIYGINDETINNIKDLRKQNKTYDEIKEIINITTDQLKKICRIYKINLPTTTFKKKELNTNEIIKYYLETKSLRKVSKKFKADRLTIRNHIPDNLIIKRKKNITKSNAVIKWRKKTKERLVNYKGGKCEICGYNRCVKSLTFHHTNPEEKDFSISGKSYSLNRMKNEVDKCILVCSNCHGEIHDGLIKL